MKAATLKCARLEFLGCREKPRCGPKTAHRGFTGQPEGENKHIGGPDRPKHHQNSTRRGPRERKKRHEKIPEREKKNENGGGRRKKKRVILGGPAGVAVRWRGWSGGGGGPLAKIRLAVPKVGLGPRRSWPKMVVAKKGHGHSRSWP